MPKFVGMALSLIGNIWAAVAACILAEGSKQKGFVQECVGRDSCERRNAAILPEEESLMHIPCSCFLKGDKSLPPPPLLIPPGVLKASGAQTDPCPANSAHSVIGAVWKNTWGGGSR